MAPKSQLTKEQRITTKVLHGEGYSTTAIASKVKCSQGAVSKTLARLKETGSTDDRKRSGRPKISSSGEDRHLVHLILQDRRLTSPQLKRQWEDWHSIKIIWSDESKFNLFGSDGRIYV